MGGPGEWNLRVQTTVGYRELTRVLGGGFKRLGRLERRGSFTID